MMAPFLVSLLSQLAFAVPVLVVYIVAIVMAQRHRKRYPVVARRVVIAAVIEVIAIVAGTVATTMVTVQREPLGLSMREMSTLFTVIGVVRALLHTLAAALLLSAVFAERGGVVPAAATSVATLPPAGLRYDQVPWYRRRGFVAITFLLFMPATLAITLSGEVYADRGGQAQKLSPSQRYGIAGMALMLMLLGLFRAIAVSPPLE